MSKGSLLQQGQQVALPGEDAVERLLDEVDAVRIWSRVLNAEVWVVGDLAQLETDAELAASLLAIFTFDELLKLADKAPDELRAIHAAKRVIPGSKLVQ